MGAPFQLGVNYWPRNKAMYWWSDFDRGEVRDEFSLITDIGLSAVRIFLLWDDFQPDPERVSTQMLSRLEQVLDAADDRGLRVNVTFFTGHMSGPNWAPRWLLDEDAPRDRRPVICGGKPVKSGFRDPYEDDVALAAETVLVSEVVGAFQTHPAVGVWNLGNEPDIFRTPASAASGQRWCRRFMAQIKALGAPQPVTVGMQAGCLVENHGFLFHEVFETADFATLHGYPMLSPWARSPVDPAFVPFLTALTRAITGKPTLVEELGGPTAPAGKRSGPIWFEELGVMREQYLVSEEEMAAHAAAVLPRLVDVGATGAMLWCFADYAEALHRRPPCDQSVHERYFGLVRKDGSLKPHAQVVRDFARSAPLVNENPPRTVNLEMSPDDYYRDPMRHCLSLYHRFCEGDDSGPDRV